jgi:hypothetical protein
MKIKLIAGLLAVLLGGFFVPHAKATEIFQADSKLNVKSIQVANNTNAITVGGFPVTLYGLEAFNSSTTVAYVKVYNSSQVTCGSGTPQARYMIPASTSATLMFNTNGDAYGAGLTICVTTGYADSDTGAPAANEYIVNVHYK